MKAWDAGRILTAEEKAEISQASIDRWLDYIEKQLEQGDEKMEKEKQIEIEHTAWDDIGGGFVKIERDKAKVLLVQGWKVEQIKKFKDDKGELKEQIEFSCDVLNEDGQNVNKKYNTTSYSALRSLKEIFYLRPNLSPVLIRVKKIGDGKSTIYDIEEIKTR
jgi:hypothetical protein